MDKFRVVKHWSIENFPRVEMTGQEMMELVQMMKMVASTDGRDDENCQTCVPSS
jgi:hypothetical protein